jgi:hypothetical protein
VTVDELSVEHFFLGCATVSITENTSVVTGVTMDASDPMETSTTVVVGATTFTDVVPQDAV